MSRRKLPAAVSVSLLSLAGCEAPKDPQMTGCMKEEGHCLAVDPSEPDGGVINGYCYIYHEDPKVSPEWRCSWV